MKKLLLIILLAYGNANIYAQTVSVADWKNGAKGAYSIIHDDYGDVGVDGIWQYADTIASNRGLKFTFGAISSSCETSRNINGEASPYAYAKNVMMAQHHHEIINHSHTHTCAVYRGWGECNGIGWGEVENTTSWNTQLVTSHNSIQTNTGHQPRYYIYPYDQFTDLANTKLQSMGYIGSRTGWHIDGLSAHAPFYKYGYEANDENLFKSNADGFFRTSVQVFDDVDAAKTDANQTLELNNEVDNAITNNEWANRELHNVGASGWGHVTVNAYRTHLNYVKTKVTAGDLWMPTVSEMLTYQIQKLVYQPAVTYDNLLHKFTVDFTEDNSIVTTDIAAYLNPLTIKTSLTLILDVTDYVDVYDFSKATIKQGVADITDFNFKNNKFYINLYPHQGNFTLSAPLQSDDNTDINDYFNNNFVKVYPNPTTGILYLSGEPKEIKIFDLVGSLMMTDFGNQIDLNSLPAGTYCVQVGNSTNLKRIVKQ